MKLIKIYDQQTTDCLVALEAMLTKRKAELYEKVDNEIAEELKYRRACIKHAACGAVAQDRLCKDINLEIERIKKYAMPAKYEIGE